MGGDENERELSSSLLRRFPHFHPAIPAKCSPADAVVSPMEILFVKSTLIFRRIRLQERKEGRWMQPALRFDPLQILA